MSDRSFDEVRSDLYKAKEINDIAAIAEYARAMDAFDTAEARALAFNARAHVEAFTGSIHTALEYYHQALAIHEEIGDRAGMARDLRGIGKSHTHIGNYSAAIDAFHRSIVHYQDDNDTRAIASLFKDIGNTHVSAGNYAEALEILHRSLAMSEELGERTLEAEINGFIGNALLFTANYPEALEKYHRALSAYSDPVDRLQIAYFTSNIGLIHLATGNHALALEYLERTTHTYEELGIHRSVAANTGNIGHIYYNTGNYPLALQYYRRALAHHKEQNNQPSVALVTTSLISVLIETDSFLEAESLFAELDEMVINEPDVAIKRELLRASLLVYRGLEDEAHTALITALEKAQQHDLPEKQAAAHRQLRDLYQRRNDFAGYIKHNNEYTRITEEINGRDTAARLAIQIKQREIDAREKEHEKQLAVLHSTLPKHIADRVARGETVNDHFDNAAVLFIDVVGFTTHSSDLDATIVVELLQNIFTSFDAICAHHDVMKIKTIGDSYMAVAFDVTNVVGARPRLAREQTGAANQIANSEQRIANAALAMMARVFMWPHTEERVMFRIGIHCGPVVAGVLGTERMQYDVWGDTVNVASRMESASEPGRIHISEALANALNEHKNSPPGPLSHALLERGSYTVVPRGTVDVKGKGAMQTYWLEGTVV